MFKIGDKVKVVRRTRHSPTASHMVGPLMEIDEISRYGKDEIWIRQLDGENKGASWVCLAGDLEFYPPRNLSPLELDLAAYIAAEKKELGL